MPLDYLRLEDDTDWIELESSTAGARDYIELEWSSLVDIPKRVEFHIFTEAGVFIRTWPDTMTVPNFSSKLFGGLAAQTIQLPRQWNSAGEPGEVGSLSDLKLGNRIEQHVIDREGEVVIYRGSIMAYTIDVEQAVTTVTVMSKQTLLWDRLVLDKSFVATDPSDMMKWFVDNGYLPGITWDPLNPLVGYTWDMDFQSQRLDSVFQIIQHLAGGFWYYRFNPDDSLTFRQWNRNAADLTMLVGREVSGGVTYERSNMDRKKRVFLYGDPGSLADGRQQVLAEVSAIGYDPAVLPMDMFVSYPRVTEASVALRMAHSLLEWADQEAITTELTVLDNNFDTHGMDIESLRCGMSIALLNPLRIFDLPVWGDGFIYGDGTIWGGLGEAQVQRPLVIAEISYHFTYATLKLTNRPSGVPEELFNLSDRLLITATRSETT